MTITTSSPTQNVVDIELDPRFKKSLFNQSVYCNHLWLSGYRHFNPKMV